MAGIAVLTVAEKMVSRCEVFDETDLDAALTRFDELHLDGSGAAAERAEN